MQAFIATTIVTSMQPAVPIPVPPLVEPTAEITPAQQRLIDDRAEWAEAECDGDGGQPVPLQDIQQDPKPPRQPKPKHDKTAPVSEQSLRGMMSTGRGRGRSQGGRARGGASISSGRQEVTSNSTPAQYTGSRGGRGRGGYDGHGRGGGPSYPMGKENVGQQGQCQMDGSQDMSRGRGGRHPDISNINPRGQQQQQGRGRGRGRGGRGSRGGAQILPTSPTTNTISRPGPPVQTVREVMGFEAVRVSDGGTAPHRRPVVAEVMGFEAIRVSGEGTAPRRRPVVAESLGAEAIPGSGEDATPRRRRRNRRGGGAQAPIPPELFNP